MNPGLIFAAFKMTNADNCHFALGVIYLYF